MPVGDLEIRGNMPAQRSRAVHGLDRGHVVPGFAPIAAGVHRQRAAHGARDPRHPLGARSPMARDVAREVRRRDTAADAKRELVAAVPKVGAR